jgi:hypothetical protein
VASTRKIQANRANARASTGPKTAQGRARTARNALRHGLSVPVFSDSVFSEEVDALAREIAGPDAGAEVLELARRVAEAQIDLRRVRYAHHQVLRGLRVVGAFTPTPDGVVEFLDSKPSGPLKLAMILSDKAGQLLAIDRYERRALSRRKFAIRAYDKSCKVL